MKLRRYTMAGLLQILGLTRPEVNVQIAVRKARRHIREQCLAAGPHRTVGSYCTSIPVQWLGQGAGCCVHWYRMSKEPGMERPGQGGGCGDV